MQKQIKVILLDFSYTLCFPKTKENVKSLNDLYKKVIKNSKQPLDNFIINQELLDYLKTLKTQYKLYIFTSGNMHTDEQIMLYLKPVFDGYFTSLELKLPKSFPDVYKIIANKLGVSPSEILFIDDQDKNLTAAQTIGVKTIKFSNNSLVKTEIEKILNKPKQLV